MRLVVTGAAGFLGSAFCRTAEAAGHTVIRVVRRTDSGPGAVRAVAEIDGRTDWSDILNRADAVIHLAARVHVMRETAADPLAAFRAANADGTRRLAEAAAAAGVRRLVLVSTIKVLGDATSARPFGPGSAPAPMDAYAQSKLEAEVALRAIGETTDLEAVVVRPPLIHGPGVGGNLRRLMALVWRGIPLPFAAVHNARSLVGIDNLVTFLLCAATAPRAAGRTLLVADQPAISTPRLVELMAQGMDRRARLWSVPPAVLRGLGRLFGRTGEVDRLLGSLQVDDRETRSLLDWTPLVTLEEGVGAMVRAFRRERTASPPAQ